MSRVPDLVRIPPIPKKIDLFVGQYRFLSNFYIEPDGTHVEGEFQASKPRYITQKAKFEGLSPYQSKQLGNSRTEISLRDDWEEVKDQIMYELLLKKFTDHADLRKRLLATYPNQIVEGNSHGDIYWGVCNGDGQNVLGRILMLVREELISKCQETESQLGC